MKKVILFFTVVFFPIIIFSQSLEESKLEISGSMLSNQRITTDNGNWIWNENRMELNFDKKMQYSKFHSQIWLRNIGLPKYYSLSSLYNKQITSPYALNIRELYAEVNGLLNDKLDLKIGKQIFSWGTADKINPTNNLSPYDYEDILDFGRKNGVWAFKFDYYLSQNFSVEGAFVPFFKPANMPIGVFSELLQNSYQFPFEVNSFSDSLYLPDYKIENASYGFRLKGFVANIDFSFSYTYGFDDLPIPYFNNIVFVDTPNIFDVHTDLKYYRRHILGFDFATNIKGIGFWGEIATFIPQQEQILTSKITTPYFDPTLNQFVYIYQKQDSVILEKKPYTKFVIGADYSFAYDFYLNVQYIHGFPFERGKEINDYFLVRLEKTMFYGKLKIAPLSGALMITDWNDMANNYAIAYFPQITYIPDLDIEMSLIGGFFTGEGNNWVNSLKDYNMLMFQLKYYF